MTSNMPEFVAPLVPSVVPADTLNKKDLYDHLSVYHGHVGHFHSITSKSSKEAMEDLHAHLHENIDYTVAQSSLQYNDEGYQVWVDNPALADLTMEERNKFSDGHTGKVHEHLVVPTGPATEEERKTLNAVTEGSLGRVLQVTERKALERLIDNDFAALRNEMHAYAKDVLEERLKTVAEEFADKQKEAEKHRKTLVKVIQDTNAKIVKMIEDAKVGGVTLTGLGTAKVALNDALPEQNVKAVVAGQAEAEKKVRAENQSDVQSALHTLERQRLASQRLVLLAGISPEGQKLLDTIPNAKTLMVEAAKDRSAKQIEA